MAAPQLTFDQVYSNYRKSGTDQSLSDWATFANEFTGTDAYSAGKVGWLPEQIKKGSYWIDEELRASGLPDKTAQIGRDIFEYFGGSPEFGAEVGREIPRGFVDMAPMFIPYAGPLLRLGGAGALMAGHTYADTDSVGRAAVAGATPLIGAAGGKVAINALAKTPLVNPIVKTMEMMTRAGNPTGRLITSAALQGTKDKTLGYLAQQTGALAAMEMTGYATEAIASETWNPFEGRSVRDWGLATLLTQVPYATADFVRLPFVPMPVGKPTVAYKAPESAKIPPVDISTVSSADAMRRAFDVDRARTIAEAMKVDDPVKRQAVVEEAMRMHEYKNNVLDGKLPSEAFSIWGDVEAAKTKTVYDKLLQLKSVPPEQRDPFIVNDAVRELRERMLVFRQKDRAEVASESALAETVAETDLARAAADELSVPEGFDSTTGKVVLDSPSEMRDEVSDVLMENNASPQEAIVDATVGVRNREVEQGQRKVRESDMTKARVFEELQRSVVDETDQAGINEVNQAMRTFGSEVEPKRLINAWYNWRERRLAGDARAGVHPIMDLRAILGRVLSRARLPKQLEASRFERDDDGKVMGFATRDEAQILADNLNRGLKDETFTYQAYSDRGRNGPGEATPFGVKRKYRSEADRKIAEVERGSRDEDVAAEAKETTEVLTDTSVDPDAKMARIVARKSLEKFLIDNGRELGLDETKLMALFAKIKSKEADPKAVEEALAKMLAAKRAQLEEDSFFADREEEEYRDDSQRSAAKKYSASAGDGFRFKLGDVFSEDDGGRILVGSKVVGKGGMVPEAVFNSQTTGRVSKDELALWKLLVPKAWTDKGVHISFLRNELEKLPQLETRRLDIVPDQKANEIAQRVDALAHELDTLQPRWAMRDSSEESSFSPEVLSKIAEWEALSDQLTDTVSSPESATARFSTVNPYPLDILQGKREIAPGHKVVWSGDLSVNVPRPGQKRLDELNAKGGNLTDAEVTEMAQLANTFAKESPFQSAHYPSGAGVNQLAFVRGAIHEYQPGSTLPDGSKAEKVTKLMEVWEVQSDWASSHKRNTDRILADQKQYEQYLQHAKDNNLSYVERMPDEVDSWKKGLESPTPLLPHWESLAYKAAVNEALAQGADAIVLSDAESAMMTEGHDKYSRYLVEGPDVPPGRYANDLTTAQRIAEQVGGTVRGPVVDQEGGMRAAYDERGPNILKKLTGSAGREVEMGVHENVKKDRSHGSRTFTTEEEARAYHTDTQSRIYQNEAGEWVGIRASGRYLDPGDGSPVFKDALGSPKTTNTGRLFDLTSLRESRLATDTTSFPLVGAKRSGSVVDPVVEQPKIMPGPEETIRQIVQLSGGNAKEQDLFGRFLTGVYNIGKIPFQKLGIVINNDPRNQIWGLGNRAAGGTRASWLAPTTGEMTPKNAREMAVSISHETGHVVEGAVRGGFAPPEVLRANEVWNKFLDEQPDRALEFMRDWRDTLPKDYQHLASLNQMLDGSPYSKQAHELYATGMALWAAGHMKAEEAKAWGILAPPEAKSWFKELTKYAQKMIGALRSAVFMRKGAVTPEFHESLQAVKDMYAATVKGVREAEVSMETLRSWAEAGTKDVWALHTKGQKFFGTDKAAAMKELEGGFKEVGMVEKMWNEAIRTLDGLGRQMPVFNRIVSEVHRHATTISRFRNEIMGNVVGGVNPDTGTLSMSGPAAKMYRMVQRASDAHTNALASEMMQWKQVTGGEDTKFSLDQIKSARPVWPPAGTRRRDLYAEFNKLPDIKKQAVLQTIAGLEQGHRQAAQQTVETQLQTGRNLMMMYFGKALPKERWASAPDLTEKFTQAVDQAMAVDPATKLVGEQSMEVLRKVINDDKVFQGALDMWMDTHVGVKELSEFYAGKPGHQSMMRSGKYLARAYDKDGHQYTDAVQDLKEYSEWQAKARSSGFTRFDEPQIMDQTNNFKMGDEALNVLDAIEKRKQDRINSMDLPEDLRAMMIDATNVSGDVARMMAAKDVRIPADIQNIQGGKRRKIPGSMDMVETQKLFFNVVSRLNANRLMKTRLAYELSNPELVRFPREVESFKRQLDNYMRPDSAVVRALQRTNSVMFLGGNVSSVMVNGLQTPLTGYPELINRGIGGLKAIGLIGGAVKDVSTFSGHLLAEKAGIYDDHKAIKKMKNKDEQELFTWANHEGVFSVSSLAELSDLNADAAIDLNRVGHYDRPMKPAEKAKSAVSTLANFSMKAFAASEQYNKRIALLLGYRAAKEKLGNVPKEELFDYARDFMYATTYAGGRANRPLLQGDTGVFGAAAYSLGSYTMGWLNQQIRYIQHWKGAEYLNLRPEEKQQAKKAALHMLGIQVGAAGLLGLPFAGAMLKVMEKLTGENFTGEIYEKLGALFDQDDQEGGGFGQTVMTGVANAALANAGVPIDVGSRWGLSSTLGLNSFDGFNGDAVFGPTGSLVSSALAGIKSSFQGDFGAAAKHLAPAAIKKAVAYYVNGGQAETSKGSKVEMGDAETLGYIVGFNSQKLAALQKYRGIEIAQEEHNALERAQETAEILGLLQSNPTAAHQEVARIAESSGGAENRQQIARRVAEAAAEKIYPKDVRATAGKRSGEFLMNVAQTMGVPIPQANQVARRSYIDQVMMMLGARPQRPSRRAWRQDELGSEYTPFAAVQ